MIPYIYVKKKRYFYQQHPHLNTNKGEPDISVFFNWTISKRIGRINKRICHRQFITLRKTQYLMNQILTCQGNEATDSTEIYALLLLLLWNRTWLEKNVQVIWWHLKSRSFNKKVKAIFSPHESIRKKRGEVWSLIEYHSHK